MKLTAGQLHDAMSAIVEIANRPRQIPQMAKFKLARLHDALEPEYTKIETERIALVQKFGSEKFQDTEKTKSLGWGLYPNDSLFPEYLAGWNVIRNREIELPSTVTPITVQLCGNDPKGIELNEFKQLGPLCVDADHE